MFDSRKGSKIRDVLPDPRPYLRVIVELGVGSKSEKVSTDEGTTTNAASATSAAAQGGGEPGLKRSAIEQRSTADDLEEPQGKRHRIAKEDDDEDENTEQPGEAPARDWPLPDSEDL